MCHSFIKKMKGDNHKLHHLIPEERQCPYNLRRQKQYSASRFCTKRAEGLIVNCFQGAKFGNGSLILSYVCSYFNS